MAKKRSADRSPMKVTSRGPMNVYEDSDSDKSEEIIVRGREKRGSAVEHDGSWRRERNRGDDYDSDDMRYRSPREDRRQRFRSPPRGVHDEYYARGRCHDRNNEGPGSSRVRRERSPTGEMSYRDSGGRSGQCKDYDERDGRKYSWKDLYSTSRRSPNTEDRHGRMNRGRSSPYRPQAEEVRLKSRVRKRKKVLKPIQVDGLGIPVGLMKD